MRFVILLILASLLVGCATKQEIEAQKLPVVRLSSGQIANVETAVRKTLPRPNAHYFFKSYRAGKNPDGSIMVCGWVRGPDRYGWPSWHTYTGVLKATGEFVDAISQSTGADISLACFVKGIGSHAWDE